MRLEAANLTDKRLVTFESIEVVRPIENLRLGGPSSFYFDLGGERSQDRDINEEMTLFDSNSVDRHIKYPNDIVTEFWT